MPIGRVAVCGCVVGIVLAALDAAPLQMAPTADAYVAEITRARQIADRQLRGPFSPLAKIQSHRLDAGRVLMIGRDPGADARLDGLEIASKHAVIEGDSLTPTVRALGGAWITTMGEPSRAVPTLTIKPGWGFRIGRFVFEYNVSEILGRMIQIFDPDHPRVLAFEGLEYFPIDPTYRVTANVVPHPSPSRVALLDSQGRLQQHWLYGELRFTLRGVPSRLEVYVETLDGLEQKGFMVIFADQTSGNDTYPAARYLMTGPPANGSISLDFNRAFNPPCVYSPHYSCPFPRTGNWLGLRVEAGAKWYRK